MKKNNVYAVFEFDNYSETGLKKFASLLNRKDCAVASITATNRVTRKDGLLTKKAVLFFDNQQKAEIVIGDAGDIVLLKINGKPQPSGLPKSLAEFARHIATLLKRGQAAFDKALKRRTAKIKVDTPKKKVAARTNKARIEESETLLKEAQSALAEVRIKEKEITESASRTAVTQNKLLDEYGAAQKRNKELKAQLNKLKKAA